MAVLRRVQGIQELVGVCLERFKMATKYGGPILQRWLGSKSPLLPQQWFDIPIKITKTFRDIHSLDVIHNDIKTNNLCLEVTPDGIEVTLIDFGLFERRGKYLRLSGDWCADEYYLPEFFERRTSTASGGS
ncbi:uncharacterized protein LOC125045704 [Penaeus chinensis]|uniref:uncharacterized protein LOC125045704 n=1 Tax=Penaeus chinensis TaxID=139456 RepID=UPI001FB6A457|nr:uncharacterized protein LOC125045704 [Penaeus chinensis]